MTTTRNVREYILHGGIATAPIIRAVFNKRIPSRSREHAQLYDRLVEKYNKLYFERHLEKEKVPREKLWTILLLMYTTLKFVYEDGMKEEYGDVDIESPYVNFRYYIGSPNIINFSEDELSAASYEIGLGDVAFLVDNEEFIDLSREGLVLEPRSAALVLSREYVILPENMTGIVRTRLALHLRGLAPVSHKLDPCYHGPILFMLYNVTKNKRIYVSKDEAIADVRIDIIPTLDAEDSSAGPHNKGRNLLYWRSYAPEKLITTIKKLASLLGELQKLLKDSAHTQNLLGNVEQQLSRKFEGEELDVLENFVLRYLRLQLFKTVLKLSKPVFYIQQTSHNVQLLKYLVLYEVMRKTSFRP